MLLQLQKIMMVDTPLHIAVSNESVPCILSLSPGGLDVQNNNGNTPLHVACLKRSICAVHYLLTHFSNVQEALSAPNKDEDLPLYIALRFRCKRPILHLRAKSLHKMVELTKSNHDRALQIACQFGKVYYAPFARHFRNEGARIDISDQNGKLPIHHAARFSLEFVKACASSHLINQQDENGDTPLHIACSHSKYDVCKYLVTEMRCSVTIRNKKGELPLHTLCSVKPVRNKIVSLLLKHTVRFTTHG